MQLTLFDLPPTAKPRRAKRKLSAVARDTLEASSRYPRARCAVALDTAANCLRFGQKKIVRLLVETVREARTKPSPMNYFNPDTLRILP
jgi:hypothetical protein